MLDYIWPGLFKIMIVKIEDPFRIDNRIKHLLGESLSGSNGSFLKEIGSCSFNLRDFRSNKQEFLINKNARCNFELFNKGVLLRINDNQKYFLIPLPGNQNVKIELFKGAKKVRLSGLGVLLNLLGVDRRFIERYWIFRDGYSYERLKLLIETEEEEVLLDSNGRNFKEALAYFSNSKLNDKITIHNKPQLIALS